MTVGIPIAITIFIAEVQNTIGVQIGRILSSHSTQAQSDLKLEIHICQTPITVQIRTFLIHPTATIFVVNQAVGARILALSQLYACVQARRQA